MSTVQGATIAPVGANPTTTPVASPAAGNTPRAAPSGGFFSRSELGRVLWRFRREFGWVALFSFFANVLILPLWLQTRLGYTATWAGLVAAPSGVIAVLLTPLATRYMARADARWFATLALVAFAASYFMRANLTATASFRDFVLPMLVQGIALTSFFVSLVTISLDSIAPQRIPSASGISNFSRITAGGFAASITTTLWDRRAATSRAPCQPDNNDHRDAQPRRNPEQIDR